MNASTNARAQTTSFKLTKKAISARQTQVWNGIGLHVDSEFQPRRDQ